jgi:hypothetical protein
LTDTRAFAFYPTPAIAIGVFLMIVSRLGSLHALEQDRKDERRDLIQDARGLFAGQVPKVVPEKALERLLWDVEDLTKWTAFAPVRVVRSVETRTVVRQRNRREETVQTEWTWMTTVPQAETSGAQIAADLAIPGPAP